MPVPVGAILGNSGSGINGAELVFLPPVLANQVRHGSLLLELLVLVVVVVVVVVVLVSLVSSGAADCCSLEVLESMLLALPGELELALPGWYSCVDKVLPLLVEVSMFE